MIETSTNLSQEVVHLRQQLAELEVTKERYRAIVATADHIIIGLRPDHTIFEWNKSAEKLYGWSSEEALGKNYLEHFLPEEVRQSVAEDIARVLAGTPTEGFENPVVTRDGIKTILWNVTRLLDDTDTPYGIIAIGQDITHYKEAEKEARQLLATEQRHVRDLALLDRVRSALARELDLHKLIHIVVEAIAETFGYTLVSLYLLEDDTLILQHQVGYDQVIREIKINEGVSGRVVRTGQPILLQDVRDDPAFLGAIEGIVSEVTVPLFDQGQVAGTLNVESVGGIQLMEADLALVTALGEHVSIAIERARLYTDEREQRLLVETLSRIGLALSATLDLPTLLNLICRESVNLLQVHSAFIWLVEGDEMVGFAGYGFGREMFIGLREPKSNQELLAARIIRANRPEYVNNAQKSDRLDVQIMRKYQCQAILGVPLAKGDEVIGGLVILENRDPWRFGPGDLKMASVLGSHAAVAIENARLYTDLETRVAERTYELQAAYEELKKLDKLKTKLIDDISHELRTPTSNVMLYLDLLERGALENKPRYHQVLRAEVTRLARLVEGIIHLSEIDLLKSEARFTAVDLNQLVQQTVASFKKQASINGLALTLELQDDVQSVWGDERQLAEALRHLLSNALNYTQSGQIHIRTYAQLNMCVEIADTGMGIEPGDLPYIFDRFYRGQGVSQLTFSGAGLGLFIVQEIITLHGGEVSVSSRLNEGSTFCICLPVAHNQKVTSKQTITNKMSR